MKAGQGRTEEQRLEAIRRYQILDSPRERAFDDLVEFSSDFISMATLDGKVLYLNQAGRDRVRDALQENWEHGSASP